MSLDIFTAAKCYVKERGWVVHPLSSPKDKGTSPGKRPLLPEWQKKGMATETEIDRWFNSTDNNIGLVCGKPSGVTVVDFDNELFLIDLLSGLDINTLKSQRTKDRCHLFFRHNPNLPAQKHHNLGIEVLSDGSNVVLPPSIHASGDVYKWANPDAPIMEMPKELEKRLKELFKTETELKQIIAKTRTCFRDVLQRRPDVHGAEGREYMLAICTDLVRKRAREEHLKLFAKLMYRQDYDETKTLNELKYIDEGKTWKCETLQQKVPSLINLDRCEECEKRREKAEQKKEENPPLKVEYTGKRKKEEKSEAVQTSFLEMENKVVEEIFRDGRPQFVIYDTTSGSYEYAAEFKTPSCTYLPVPIGDVLQDSLILPDGVEEYGSLKSLREEMLSFALAEFDPVSNFDLYRLCVHLFLTSWIAPLWQSEKAEKFIPIIDTRGPSETGKKRFLTVMRWLTYRSIYALKSTKVPSLFRACSVWRGTLILDEADLTDSTESGDVVQFLNSRADGVPIPRYNSNTGQVEWFYSFGMTGLATRKAFIDDGLNSRCVIFPSESTENFGKYNLLPPEKWVEWGRSIQRKLMLFRLRHMHGDMPSNLLIDGMGFRVRESLLMLQALSSEDPEIISDLESIAKKLHERMIAERAGSPEGLILNFIYGRLDSDDVSLRKWQDGYEIDIATTTESSPVTTPLTLRNVSEGLGKAFNSSEISRYWRGFDQGIRQQERVGEGRVRGILVIKSPKRLRKEFFKYVPEAEDKLGEMLPELKSKPQKTLEEIPTGAGQAGQAGQNGCNPPSEQKVVTDVTDVTAVDISDRIVEFVKPRPGVLSSQVVDKLNLGYKQSYDELYRAIKKLTEQKILTADGEGRLFYNGGNHDAHTNVPGSDTNASL